MRNGADEDDVLLHNTARLAHMAENFIGSDLGQYLLARAEAEERSAMAELKTAKPEEPDKIRELQNKIWRAETFHNWIMDAIAEGEWAREELENR